MHVQRRETSSAGMPAVSPPSKDVTSTAVIRRPSWSNRSSSFDAAPGLPNAVGYSVSPVLDSLGSSLFSSGTPKVSQLPVTPTATVSLPPLTQGSAGMDGSQDYMCVSKMLIPIQSFTENICGERAVPASLCTNVCSRMNVSRVDEVVLFLGFQGVISREDNGLRSALQGG